MSLILSETTCEASHDPLGVFTCSDTGRLQNRVTPVGVLVRINSGVHVKFNTLLRDMNVDVVTGDRNIVVLKGAQLTIDVTLWSVL